LFVSKVNYGARVPQTAVAFPMVHDTIPVAKVKSYSKFLQILSMRLLGFEKPAHNVMMVFNCPTDTVYQFFDRSGRRADKHLDKKIDYLKRSVRLSRDNLEMKSSIIYINDQVLDLGDRARIQYAYSITTDGTPLDVNFCIRDLQVTAGIPQ